MVRGEPNEVDPNDVPPQLPLNHSIVVEDPVPEVPPLAVNVILVGGDV